MKRILFICPALLLGGLPSSAPAQGIVIPLPADAAADPIRIEIKSEDLEAAVKEAPAEEVPEEPKTPEEELIDELLKLDFNRSPEAIFKALGNEDSEGDPGPAQVFNEAVMFGDWAIVRDMLAELPGESAQEIYSKLIKTLGTKAVAVGTLLQEPAVAAEGEDPNAARQRLRDQQRMQQELSRMPAPLLSEDFYGLIEAAPGGVTDEQIASVAKLAEVAIGEGGRESLISRLKAGWKGLGGDTTEGSILATKLLSSLGWISDAGPFLPLEEAEWEDADLTQLVFTMEYFTTVGVENRDERELARAAAVCARLMKSTRIGNYTRPQFRLAMERLVTLLPALEPEAAQQLIREQLFSQTASLADLISIFGEEGQKTAKATDLPARVASLRSQHLILDALVTMKEDLPANVAVLVLNWLAEAEGCYRAGGVVATEMSQTERMMMRRYGMGSDLDVKTLGTDQILATSPPEAIVSRLNPGLEQRVKLTLLKLKVLSVDALDLEQVKQYAEQHPGLERQICQDVLAAWISKQRKPSESARVKQLRAYGMYVPPQMTQAGQSIPLTRLRQNRNIEELKTLLGELREISPEPLDPALIVEGFMTLHSGAEVYKTDDVIAIFGAPETMVRAELLNLLEGMRGRLGEEWRDPATQQQAATNRTEKETKDEVSRGYRTALELASRGIPDDDSDWQALITRGRLFYDASQYEFDREIQLSEYVDLRDRAFGSFKDAADQYAGGLPEMPKGQWTIEPYQAWFLVMLGASDLAQLTSNPARTDPGLQAIGDALRALPGEAADRHLMMFGEMLGNLFPRVPANVRQRFLSSGLKIIGEDHPAADVATRSLEYYRELLDEIQLRATVDGPTDVGHGEPFGLFLSIESTRQLLRESGGFGKYLRGSANQGRMGGGPARDLRGDFEKNIHAALDETFEVIALVFHDPGVKPLPLAREGWMETPLVYAVLRAKNAAVDRIPSIQLDMDFVDQPGQVVLPVMSQVQPINARAEELPPRRCPELAFEVTLDERDWKDGTLAVEITAKGQGIIADLDEWFDYQRKGFEAEVVDGQLAVTELVSDGISRAPRADRNWQITYRRKADVEAIARFPLPQPTEAAKSASFQYRLYRETDLLELTAEEAAKGIELTVLAKEDLGRWLIIGGGGLAVLLFGWLLLRPRKAKVSDDKVLTAPSEPTPFTTVAFLRRVRSEYGSQLSEDEQQAISTKITEIESKCFRATEESVSDLPAIVKKWLRVARRKA